VPRVVVNAIHLDQLREHGGLSGIRDENALESALARPRQKWHYSSDVDLAALAAAYVFGLSKAHAFSDGNKRIAFLTAMTFFGLNGKELNASESEVVQVVIAIAEGSMKEAQLVEWLRSRIVRLAL